MFLEEKYPRSYVQEGDKRVPEKQFLREFPKEWLDHVCSEQNSLGGASVEKKWYSRVQERKRLIQLQTIQPVLAVQLESSVFFTRNQCISPRYQWQVASEVNSARVS